jgi:hypothetical protein
VTKAAPVDRLLEALHAGRGERVICLGVTGMGKSHALRALGAAAATMVDVLYVVDDTEDAHRWGGQRRADIDDCHARPLVPAAEGGSNVVVLTGRFRKPPDAESVAADAWALVQRGYKCAVVMDELRRATSAPQHWQVRQGEVATAFSEGRKYGLSVLAATNFPQEVPREALGGSHLVLFRAGGGDRAAAPAPILRAMARRLDRSDALPVLVRDRFAAAAATGGILWPLHRAQLRRR